VGFTCNTQILFVGASGPKGPVSTHVMNHGGIGSKVRVLTIKSPTRRVVQLELREKVSMGKRMCLLRRVKQPLYGPARMGPEAIRYPRRACSAGSTGELLLFYRGIGNVSPETEEKKGAKESQSIKVPIFVALNY